MDLSAHRLVLQGFINKNNVNLSLSSSVTQKQKRDDRQEEQQQKESQAKCTEELVRLHSYTDCEKYIYTGNKLWQ